VTVGRPVAVDPHPIMVGLSLKLSKGNPLYLSGKQAGLKPRRKVTGRCNFTSAISFFNVLLSNLEFQKKVMFNESCDLKGLSLVREQL
jgi:hypothetical protein